MIKRVRDKLRTFKPLQVVSFADWEQIEDKARIASTFMKVGNPLYDAMVEDLENAKTIVLQNRVKEVRDIHIISDVLQKIFITRKEEQMDELVGQIKYIRDYLAELQSWVTLKADLERQEGDGRIVIRRSKEDENRGKNS